MSYNPEYLYLTTIGRKTGQPHEIEIWYVAFNNCYYLVAEQRERSHWVQNIQKTASIRFWLNGKSYSGTGRIVDRQAEPKLADSVTALMDAKYNWSDGLIVEVCPDGP
jgi:deazaflavin-dependent oxidoreductase (nitroreductase family)